jgi:nucleoside-triphosphatase THEP1
LSDALGLAFGALPAFTALLADQRTFWRKPVSTLGRMLQMADTFYVPRFAGGRSVVILTGGTGSGKTTRAGEVVDVLRRRGFEVGGILARGLLRDARRSGFDLVDLCTGHTMPWCREQDVDAHAEQRWGRFEFTREGLQFGCAALTVGSRPADVMVLDEVGPLELAGGGWADSLDLLVERFGGPILLVARLAVVDAVKTRWGSASTPVCDVARDAPDAIADLVLEQVTTTGADPVVALI